ncbi:MAG: 23S rRNA (adenine(2503)-C(2))-methyltransferase RlmN [Planctomycetota bacterium]|nr:23S rRNA (adenine(2503)-C(2))-methyltransferase RlmN [Planctomycetota bacterium]
MDLPIIDSVAQSPLQCTCREWEERCGEAGRSRQSARTEWVDCLRRGALPEAIARSISIRSVSSGDGTTKFLIRLPDNHETESVILPLIGKGGRVRNTLCVSSQVGCAMGCRFCETAQMGLIRNLSVAEILLQWHVATHHFKQEIRNIVFMGMGEPLDNVEAVIGAIRILTDRRGPSLASRRISISTVGRIDGIRTLSAFLTDSGIRNLRLAVSVNAADDETRSSIMPLNRSMNMGKLRDALADWSTTHGGTLLLEYVLIPGVNDDPTSAARLAEWVGDLPARINLIPANPRRDSPWPAPDEDRVDSFLRSMQDTGLTVHRRVTQGRSLMAACGQLGNEHIRNRRRVSQELG